MISKKSSNAQRIKRHLESEKIYPVLLSVRDLTYTAASAISMLR